MAIQLGSTVTFLYRCCEHCDDDPRYHEENPPDSHDTWCSLPGCMEGKRAIESPDPSTKENDRA